MMLPPLFYNEIFVMASFKSCIIKSLPVENMVAAAEQAVQINPANAPPVVTIITSLILEPQHLALLTSKYWGASGVSLTVSFLDNPSVSLRRKILQHANSWGEFSNVKFVETAADGQVRIARTPRSGYWSYLGTDILQIPKNQPTMNLDSFSDRTSDSEFTRVVRHEVGHVLGAPHEHFRRGIVSKIDPSKAIAYFGRTQGWSPQMVQQQVLTPLEESSLLGTEFSDEESIMTYSLPGSITYDGKPIIGGKDINANDRAFAAKVYPLVTVPPPQSGSINLSVYLDKKQISLKFPEGWSVV